MADDFVPSITYFLTLSTRQKHLCLSLSFKYLEMPPGLKTVECDNALMAWLVDFCGSFM